MRTLPFLLLGMITFFILTPLVRGDEVTDLDAELQNTKQKLEDAQQEKQQTQQKIQELENQKQQYHGTLNNLQYSVSATQNQLAQTQETIAAKEAEIVQTEQDIADTQQTLEKRRSHLFRTIRSLYKNSKSNWLTFFLNGQQSRAQTHNVVYQHAISQESQEQATSLSEEVAKLDEIKILLNEIKQQLEADKAALEQQKRVLQYSIGQTQQQLSSAQNQQQNFQQSLAGIDNQINTLTQKQQQILAAKAAAALASTTVGNQEINRAAIEKATPNDGNVYFSFWTYGYPHRVGLSQYGALGRAMSGQNYTQIIKAYYAGVQLESWSGPEHITITTNEGNQELSFEDDYLMGIGEMPSCWGSPDRGGLEALKAQAVLARTYAIAYTNNGSKPICTTQSCQVYVGASKVNGVCGEYWKEAVEATKGMVVTHSGQPIQAWYSSTTGGFTLSSAEVWGGARPFAQGIKDFNGPDPYEGPKYADSPWYHKAWGNEPWLSTAQVTDLMNAALLPTSFDDQLSDLTPDEVVNRLQENNLTPVQNLTSMEVVDENGSSGANTANVAYVRAYHSGNQMEEVTGSRFKFVFNLRSPGTDAIWTTRFDIITAAEL